MNCDALAAEIIAMMDGLQVQWVLDPEQVDMAAAFADYILGVRRAIQATATSAQVTQHGDHLGQRAISYRPAHGQPVVAGFGRPRGASVDQCWKARATTGTGTSTSSPGSARATANPASQHIGRATGDPDGTGRPAPPPCLGVRRCCESAPTRSDRRRPAWWRVPRSTHMTRWCSRARTRTGTPE